MTYRYHSAGNGYLAISYQYREGRLHNSLSDQYIFLRVKETLLIIVLGLSVNPGHSQRNLDIYSPKIEEIEEDEQILM